MTSKLLLLLSLIAFKECVYARRRFPEFTTTKLSEQKSLNEFDSTPRNTNDSCDLFNLYKNLYEEMNSQNHPMIQVYYNRVVQKLYDALPANILFQQLWRIYRKCDPSTFVAMVRAQLSLYWQHNMSEYPDHDYLLMVSNGFYRIKNYKHYSSLTERTQMQLEKALKSLPNSLHHLFGHREFCLMNRQHEEIFCQTEGDDFKTNEDLDFAFTWHLTKRFHEGNNTITPIFEDYDYNTIEEEEDLKSPHVVKEISDLGVIPLNLNVALLNKHFNSFYSRWPSYDHKIGGNKSELSDFTWQQDLNTWTVELVEDDHFVFSQDEFIMCATSFYDNKRRYVFGLKNRTASDKDCQWSAGKCDRR